MDAIFTLPYSEYAAANMLAKAFKSTAGYSIFVPTSRTEKGVDLLLARRAGGLTRALTIQVKSSRTYVGTPAIRKVKNRRFKYYTWFNRFKVPPEADYFILFGLFPANQDTSKKVAESWWQSMCLVFSNQEMSEFMEKIKTKKGTPDNMFSFGFDTPKEIFLTRGNETNMQLDYSKYRFDLQVKELRLALDSM
jgi:hypothetical protein